MPSTAAARPPAHSRNHPWPRPRPVDARPTSATAMGRPRQRGGPPPTIGHHLAGRRGPGETATGTVLVTPGRCRSGGRPRDHGASPRSQPPGSRGPGPGPGPPSGRRRSPPRPGRRHQCEAPLVTAPGGDAPGRGADSEGPDLSLTHLLRRGHVDQDAPGHHGDSRARPPERRLKAAECRVHGEASRSRAPMLIHRLVPVIQPGERPPPAGPRSGPAPGLAARQPVPRQGGERARARRGPTSAHLLADDRDMMRVRGGRARQQAPLLCAPPPARTQAEQPARNPSPTQ